MDWMAYDVALLHTASRFDLSDRAGRAASALWLRNLFLSTVSALNVRLVLELGAAEAGFSRQVRPLVPKAVVHALEANPYVHRKHRKEVEAADVRYHNLAVGGRTGQATFNVGRRKSGENLSPTKTNNSILTKIGDRDYEGVDVPMTTVDDFVAEQALVQLPCAMWVDVEGLAFDVLSGAFRTLPDTLALMVEVEDRPFWEGQVLSSEVKVLLSNAGFVPIARDFEYSGQYNMLFVARERMQDIYLRMILELAFAAKPPS